jgi:hypothetical protein
MIINKEASYPDFHGDYCSAALMQVSIADYLQLFNELPMISSLLK